MSDTYPVGYGIKRGQSVSAAKLATNYVEHGEYNVALLIQVLVSAKPQCRGVDLTIQVNTGTTRQQFRLSLRA